PPRPHRRIPCRSNVLRTASFQRRTARRGASDCGAYCPRLRAYGWGYRRSSGSCAHMIKHSYPELFQDDPIWLPRAKAVGNRIYEFTEYLVDRLGVSDLG